MQSEHKNDEPLTAIDKFLYVILDTKTISSEMLEHDPCPFPKGIEVSQSRIHYIINTLHPDFSNSWGIIAPYRIAKSVDYYHITRLIVELDRLNIDFTLCR